MRNNKKIVLNLFIFIFYFIFSIMSVLIINLFNIKLENNVIRSIYLIFISLLYIVFLFFIYKKELETDLKKIKIQTIIKYIPIYLIGVLLMAISSSIVTKFTGVNLSDNETTIRLYIKSLPLYMCFSTIIFSPIIEEITFRKTFRNIISNNLLFIVISGFIFGLVHTNITDNTFNDFLVAIPYIIMGIDFGYIYSKSDNIFTTIFYHSMHNFILLIIQFIGG